MAPLSVGCTLLYTYLIVFFFVGYLINSSFSGNRTEVI